MTTKVRQWRVDAVHKFGCHAPQMIIVTNDDRLHKAEAEALNTAKGRSRLSDFESWSFVATQTNKKQMNGKWYSIEEYNSKIQRVSETFEDYEDWD